MPPGAPPDDQRRALEVALRRGGLSLEDLWLGYFTLGGDAGMVEVEAYLGGMMPLPAAQCDILAHAANEHLDDVTTRLRVPYSRVLRAPAAEVGLVASLVRLLEGMEQGPPELLVEQLDAAAAALDVEVTVHLVDYAQHVLVPLHSDPVGSGTFTPGEPVLLETTLAGQAYQRVQILSGDSGGRTHLWVPLLDGVERLGVLDVRLTDADDPDDPELRRQCQSLSLLLGHLITVNSGFGDALDAVRRRQPRTGAAELIWNLLPPLTAATDRFIVAGQFEPAHLVGGDAFDYALAAGRAQVGIFDSTGHSMTSGLVTTAALAAYRSVRRNGGDLYEQSAAIDKAVRNQFTGQGLYVTAVLADLDLVHGQLRYITAGHPTPLLVREGRIVKTLTGGRRPLLGVGPQPVTIGEETLQPGDSLVLYTDGITEARDEDGEFFGINRLTEFLQRATASGYPPPETVRRLLSAVMAHQHGSLQDDATIVLGTWLPPQRESWGSRHAGEPWY